MKKYKSEKLYIESPAGKMKILVLRPVANASSPSETPGILWIHGGGYALGMAGMVYISRALNLVKKYGAIVVAPEYRLSRKHPYPAALEDCYAALRYMKDNAVSLGFNPEKILVGGESAGGGLTAALCLYARDLGEIKIAFQMPLYPMLDDRDTDSSRDNHGISWNTKRNRAAWRLYLRDLKGEIPPYAAPARAEDFARLPPCYTFVGSDEAFYCETLAYVEKLQKAGVPAKVDVYPTGFHAFDMLLPFLKTSRKAAETFEKTIFLQKKNIFEATL